MMNCEQMTHLIPDYVLGTLDDVQRQQFEALLPDCPELQELLASYEAVVEPLLHSAPLSRVPEHLRSRIFGGPSPQTRQRRYWQLIAAVLVVVLVGSNIFWAQRTDDLDAEIDSLASQLSATPPAIIPQQQVPVAMYNQAHQANNFSNMTPLNQFYASNDQQALASISWARSALNDSYIGVLSTQNLYSENNEQAYQLWLYRSGEPATSAGVFDVDWFGNGMLIFELEEPINAYDEVSITEEPISGSEQPTGPEVIRESLEP